MASLKLLRHLQARSITAPWPCPSTSRAIHSSPRSSSSSSSTTTIQSPPITLPTFRRLNPSSPTPSTTSNSIPTPSAIQLLKSQPSHYIIAFLLGRKYLLHPNDLLTVPYAKDLRVGDVIEFTRITEVGSRDYTLRGTTGGNVGHAKRETAAPRAGKEGIREAVRPKEGATVLVPNLPHYLEPGLVRAVGVVVEHAEGEETLVIKKKRRKGYRKEIRSTAKYTRLRLSEITFPDSDPSPTSTP